MQEVFSVTELPAVERDAEAEMLAPLGDALADFLWIHLLVVHGAIPECKSRTRRRTHNPVWVVLLDEQPRLLPILAVAEVLRRSVRLQGSQVERIESSEVEVPARPISFLAQCPTSIQFNKTDFGTGFRNRSRFAISGSRFASVVTTMPISRTV